MSSAIISGMPVARPKIHRMPANPVRKPAAVVPKKIFSYTPYIVGVVIVLGLLAAIPAQPRREVLAEKHDDIKMLPQISVTPQISVMPLERSGEVVAVRPPEKEPVLAMMDAHVLPIEASKPVVSNQLTDESQGKTIILQGKNESIIGQMARIPLESEQITEIKSVSEVDNSTGRELLSIINKY